jgi:hypothetical protein
VTIKDKSGNLSEQVRVVITTVHCSILLILYGNGMLPGSILAWLYLFSYQQHTAVLSEDIAVAAELLLCSSAHRSKRNVIVH